MPGCVGHNSNYKYNDYNDNHMKFYGRVQELSLLSRLYQKHPAFVVITGRRRIGKTELIKEFIKDKPAVYFFVDPHKSINILIAEFADIIREQLSLPTYITFPTPEAFLEFLFTIDHPFVVVFDEFQRFMSIYPSFISQLQRLWDLRGRESNLMLLISGSSVGMIRKIFIDDKAPLFRRSDAIITMKPFPISECREILTDIGISNPDDQLDLYLLFGGIIYYYQMLEKYECSSLTSALDTLILGDLAPLRAELSSLMIEEFGSAHLTYYEILGAMAEGKSTQKSIADRTHIAPGSLPPYLIELSEILGIIEYRVPVTDQPGRSKMGRYLIKDPFVRFYCRYIYRNMSEYTRGRYDHIREKVLTEWKGFAGPTFEELVRESLVPLLHEYEKIGSWWNRKGDEIDLLATSPGGCLGIEIKNRELSFREAQDILHSLAKKMSLTPHMTGDVKQGIAARSIHGKDELSKAGYLLYDDNDFLW